MSMRILITILSLLVLAASAQGVEKPGAAYAEGLAPKKLVLSIGVDRFQDPVWRALKYSRKDAGSV